MKILILTRYSSLGASSRLRFYQYLPYLREQGLILHVRPLYNNKYLNIIYQGKKRPFWMVVSSYLKRFLIILPAKKYDCIWIQGEVFPWLPPCVEWWFRFRGIRYIVDYDDAIFHNYDTRANFIVRKLLGSKIDRVMKYAETVIAGNDYIASRATNSGAKDVKIIPTVIDLKRYQIKRKSGGGVIVGWIGTPLTSKYLIQCSKVFEMLSKKYDISIHIVGDSRVDLPNIRTKSFNWSLEDEVSLIQQFDIGVMPLQDSVWELGKCGYKLIQYMACGIPVVASPVGVNTNIVLDGKNGFLAKREDEWFKTLEALIRDRELREKLGKQGRRDVEDKYCLQVTQKKLFSILASNMKK